MLGALIQSSIFVIGLYTIFQYIEGKFKVLNEPLKKVEGKHTFQGTKTENKLEAVNRHIDAYGNESDPRK